jgi:CO/xanthine dehydrogenase FAD-binding subunit
MFPANFGYFAARSVEEALALLTTHGDDAKLLAGGHSLIPAMKLRLATPKYLIDLGTVPGLRGVHVDGDSLTIGALTVHADVAASDLVRQRVPGLAEAASRIGDVQVRNRGTIGGTLAHADPTAELPTLAVALDASFRLVGPRGERAVRAREAYLSYLTTVLEPDEILTEVRFPSTSRRSGAAFLEISRRHGDYALVSAAATVTVDDAGRCREASVALGGVGPTPVLAGPSNGELRGRPFDEATLRDASRQYTADLAPPSDVHADAEYRSEVAAVLTRRALALAFERATKGA